MGKRGPKPRSFWSQVAIGRECWIWVGTRFRNGYGRTGDGRGAHRVAYELTVGKIPDGAVAMHKCDNPPCVRPDHLQLGTALLNSEDMRAKGRGLRGTQHKVARLNETAVREIRLSYELGEGIATIARRYDVAEQTVRWVIRGRTWSWVE